MTLPPFARFRELPKKVQRQIWKNASEPEEKLEMNDTLFTHIARTSDLMQSFFYFTTPGYIMDFAFFEHYHEGKKTVETRDRLLQTCRLARATVLEVWKAAIEKIVVDEERSDVYESFGLYYSELVDVKSDLLDILAGMIE